MNDLDFLIYLDVGFDDHIDGDDSDAHGDGDDDVHGQPIKLIPNLLIIHGEAGWPPSRGGHQVCVDPINQTIYLFGGWDGLCDLSDFWRFDLRTELWTQISSDTSKQV